MAHRPGCIWRCSGSRSGPARRWRRWRHRRCGGGGAGPARREPGAQFLLAWLIPSWIVFEAVLTKLPHYVLPLYPAIAILTAGALERRVLSRSWLMRGAAWWFVIPAGAAVLAVAGAIKLTHYPAFPAWPFLA